LLESSIFTEFRQSFPYVHVKTSSDIVVRLPLLLEIILQYLKRKVLYFYISMILCALYYSFMEI
jgi:hypothetical protein